MSTGPRRSPAVLLENPDRPARLEEVLVSPPGRDEVLVRIEAAGICHTDIYARRDLKTFPLLLGHEGAGVVEEVGPGVSHVAPGDHVVLSWKVPCGRCRRCVDGRPEHCEHLLETAEPRVHRASDGAPVTPMLRAGTFCRYAVVPAMGAIPVPADLPFNVAALIGCAVATGVGAVRRTARVPAGASVAIVGLGGVGLSTLQGAALAQADPIIAVDIDPTKLELARALRATHTVDSRRDDPVRAVRDITAGLGVDYAFEVVGLDPTIRQALAMLGLGGEMILLGAAPREHLVPVDMRLILGRQQSIRGCIFGSSHPAVDFPLYARWQQEGKLKLDPFVTTTIELSAVPGVLDGETPQGQVRVVAVLA